MSSESNVKGQGPSHLNHSDHIFSWFINLKIRYKYALVSGIAVISLIISTAVILMLLTAVKADMLGIKECGDQAITITEMGSILRTKFARLSDYINMPTQQAIDEYNSGTDKFNQLRDSVEPSLKDSQLKEMLNQMNQYSLEIDTLFLGSIVAKIDGNRKTEADLERFKAARILAKTDLILYNLRQSILDNQKSNLENTTRAVNTSLILLISYIVFVLFAGAGLVFTELRSNEIKYHALFMNMQNGLAHFKVIFDSNNRPVDYEFFNVNKAFENMIGLTSSELIGKRITQILSEIENEPYDWTSAMAQVVQDGFSQRFESYFSPLDRWFSIAAYRLAKTNIVAVFSDITRHKKADEEIRQLNAVLEHKVDLRTHDLTAANEELQAMNQELFEINELLNKEIDERTRIESALAEANDELKSTIDILQKTQNELIQSEKMAALGGLVAGVAHEINTPVGTAVTAISHLQVLTRELASSYSNNKLGKKELEGFLEDCDTSASITLSNLERAAKLIKSFKQVSVDQSSETHRLFNVSEYLDEIMLSLHPKLRTTNLEVIIDCDKNLSIDSYPGAFAQIITNLLMNSLIHAYDPGATGRINITASKLENKLHLVFSDDGKGMTKDVLLRIYDPFFSTNHHAGGTGLGLNVIFNIVTIQLGGSIECTSSPGQGTTFTICIPLL